MLQFAKLEFQVLKSVFVRQTPRGIPHQNLAHQSNLIVGMGFLTFMETVLLHLLLTLQFDAHLWAWGLTLLNVYGFLWIVGHHRMLQAQGLEVQPEGIFVPFGVMYQLWIPFDHIAEIEVCEVRKAPPQGLKCCVGGRCNLTLTLKRSLRAQVLSGVFSKEVQQVHLYLPEPQKFRDAVLKATSQLLEAKA